MREATLDVVQRLWRTKLKSITLLEKWLAKTSDLDIKAGLKTQLADERRHLRMLGEEVARLGGRLQGSTLDRVLERPFAMIQAQASDAYKLSAFYHGVKAYTVVRCGRMLPFVDQALARTLEQISRDEQGHIRWAEIRLSRIDDIHEQRQLEFLIDKMEKLLDSIWSKSWIKLTAIRYKYLAPKRYRATLPENVTVLPSPGSRP
ncbi:MAG TPA: ferritin-like domain-containing protein [Dehalococcoidia bacterium]|nr:ferritin-like domain-containing protein [Dehalococcoidia bacterium]